MRGSRTDPDELDGGERRADAGDGADGAQREGHHVNCNLELQEPADVVVHRPAGVTTLAISADRC